MKFSMFSSLQKLGVKRRRYERYKRPKIFQKKVRFMIRTDQMMKITDTINDLKAMCRDIQSSLQSTNKTFQILRHRYQTLRDFMSQRKLDIVKEFRDDPL